MLNFFSQFTSVHLSYLCGSYVLLFVESPLLFASRAYLGLGILSTQHLIDATNVDTVETNIMAVSTTIAKQLFGVTLVHQSWEDYWIPVGLSGYFTLALLKEQFGVNHHKYYLLTEGDSVFEENRLWHTILSPSKVLHPSELDNIQFHRKATVVMYTLIRQKTQTRVHPFLCRTTKLVLEHKDPSQQYAPIRLTDMKSFLQNLTFQKMRTPKDAFVEYWCKTACAPHIQVAYQYKPHTSSNSANAIFYKRIALAIWQFKLPCENTAWWKDATLFLNLHEEGVPHAPPRSVKITDERTTHALDLYSKTRRYHRRLKTETETDFLAKRAEEREDRMEHCPIEFVTIDPNVEWPLCKIEFSQKEDTLRNQLTNEPNVSAQLRACEALIRYRGSSDAYEVLRRVLGDREYFWYVRVQAAHAIAQFVHDSNFEDTTTMTPYQTLHDTFHALFFNPAPAPFGGYLWPNDWSNRSLYLVKKGLVDAIGNIRYPTGQLTETSFDCIEFLLYLLKNNDNHLNKYNDTQYIIAIMYALVQGILNCLRSLRDIHGSHLPERCFTWQAAVSENSLESLIDNTKTNKDANSPVKGVQAVQQLHDFVRKVLDHINRLCNIGDGYSLFLGDAHELFICGLRAKQKLQSHKLVPLEFYPYWVLFKTHPSTKVRIAAAQCMCELYRSFKSEELLDLKGSSPDQVGNVSISGYSEVENLDADGGDNAIAGKLQVKPLDCYTFGNFMHKFVKAIWREKNGHVKYEAITLLHLYLRKSLDITLHRHLDYKAETMPEKPDPYSEFKKGDVIVEEVQATEEKNCWGDFIGEIRRGEQQTLNNPHITKFVVALRHIILDNALEDPRTAVSALRVYQYLFDSEDPACLPRPQPTVPAVKKQRKKPANTAAPAHHLNLAGKIVNNNRIKTGPVKNARTASSVAVPQSVSPQDKKTFKLSCVLPCIALCPPPLFSLTCNHAVISIELPKEKSQKAPITLVAEFQPQCQTANAIWNLLPWSTCKLAVTPNYAYWGPDNAHELPLPQQLEEEYTAAIVKYWELAWWTEDQKMVIGHSSWNTEPNSKKTTECELTTSCTVFGTILVGQPHSVFPRLATVEPLTLSIKRCKRLSLWVGNTNVQVDMYSNSVADWVMKRLPCVGNCKNYEDLRTFTFAYSGMVEDPRTSGTWPTKGQKCMLQNELALWYGDPPIVPEGEISYGSWNVAIGTGTSIKQPPEKKQKTAQQKERQDGRKEYQLVKQANMFGIICSSLSTTSVLRVTDETRIVLQERQLLVEFILPSKPIDLATNLDACGKHEPLFSLVLTLKDNETANCIYDNVGDMHTRLDMSVSNNVIGITTPLRIQRDNQKRKDMFHCTDVALGMDGCTILIGARPHVEVSNVVIWASITGIVLPGGDFTTVSTHPLVSRLERIVQAKLSEDFFGRIRPYCTPIKPSFPPTTATSPQMSSNASPSIAASPENSNTRRKRQKPWFGGVH
eukprot:NODE_1_length_5092_cov_322.262638_g0_i0.p1 GENE.NODE_1_length_5092_cov_322.262638_g0_i0~~NODE_1_length_5092_cov_322.262638_g0_i0.p1  ORF type:complete len:1656 (-),score=374.04 NODE_1_length_5092_cov_322.262638_g0_i0:123-4523(-)